MKRLSKSIFPRILVATVVVSWVSSVAAQFDDVRVSIEKKFAAQNLPSLAVAVAQDGKIVWEEGFGWADREKEVPATEQTMYSLASISKPITAAALMVLVERGQIDLDRPINDYLGDAKLNGRAFDASKATVRRVANHTAGLPLHYQFFYQDEPYRRPDMDETIRRCANLVTPPGERWQYSNLGYGIIDYVIQRVSGREYADFMREEVFVPLGLTRMSVHIGPGLEDFTATRYAPDGKPLPFYDFDHPGGSAIFSSAHDLVRFGMFHLKNRLPDQQPILTDDSIDEMHRPATRQQNGSGYGIGWASGEFGKGLRIVSHGRGMGGVATVLRLLPKKNAAIVVLCNSSSSVPRQIAQEIQGLLISEGAEVQASKETKVAGSKKGGDDAVARRSQQPAGPQFKAMPELTGVWSGAASTYEGTLRVTFVIRESGEIYIQLGSRPWTVLDRAKFSDSVLSGIFMGDVGTVDTNRRPYNLRLEVKKRGDVLNGSLIALSLPGNRAGNSPTHWIEVKRESSRPLRK